MNFAVSFARVGQVSSPESAESESGVDGDYETLVIESCEALSAAAVGRFHMGGFGQAEWPVDVGYDMAVFVEQIPALLAALRGYREAEVDMYSQGIERTLTFSSDGEITYIDCLSRTSWIPEPTRETIARDDLLTMLTVLIDNYIAALTAIKFRVGSLPSLELWLEGKG